MGDAAIQRVIDVCQDLDPWLEGQPSVRIEHASLLSDSMLKELKGAKNGLPDQELRQRKYSFQPQFRCPMHPMGGTGQSFLRNLRGSDPAHGSRRFVSQ